MKQLPFSKTMIHKNNQDGESFIYYKNNIEYSDNVMKISAYRVVPSKHFVKTWMRKWDYDIPMLHMALCKAHKILKVGKNKYEAYVHAKRKSRKIIFVKDDEEKEIFIITGTEKT